MGKGISGTAAITEALHFSAYEARFLLTSFCDILEIKKLKQLLKYNGSCYILHDLLNSKIRKNSGSYEWMGDENFLDRRSRTPTAIMKNTRNSRIGIWVRWNPSLTTDMYDSARTGSKRFHKKKANTKYWESFSQQRQKNTSFLMYGRSLKIWNQM